MEKKQTKKTHLQKDIYNIKGEAIGKISLPAEIFDAKINPVLLRQAVHVYTANQRLGTHSTKTRSEVSGSTRKIYRQKGTGRARHGDIKAPIFIGGGIAHGPKPRDYSLSLPKKMKRLALFGALTDKLQNGRLKIVAGLADIKPKTKSMLETLDNLQLINKNNKGQLSVLLVLAGNVDNIILAGRNLKGLEAVSARLLNTYEVLKRENLLIMEEAVKILEENFAGFRSAIGIAKKEVLDHSRRSLTAKEKEVKEKKTAKGVVKKAKKVKSKK